MTFIKEKIMELILSIISVVLSLLLTGLLPVENKILLNSIAIIIFIVFYNIIKYSKRFFNPFCIEIEYENKSNSVKKYESDIIINSDNEMTTIEKLRTVDIVINMKFQNTISRYILGKIVAENNIYLSVYTDSEIVRLTTNKISDKTNKDNPRALLIKLSPIAEKLSLSNTPELTSMKNEKIILEYVGFEYPNSNGTNIHSSFYSDNWKNKKSKLFFHIFKKISILNRHEIFIKSE